MYLIITLQYLNIKVIKMDVQENHIPQNLMILYKGNPLLDITINNIRQKTASLVDKVTELPFTYKSMEEFPEFLKEARKREYDGIEDTANKFNLLKNQIKDAKELELILKKAWNSKNILHYGLPTTTIEGYKNHAITFLYLRDEINKNFHEVLKANHAYIASKDNTSIAENEVPIMENRPSMKGNELVACNP